MDRADLRARLKNVHAYAATPFRVDDLGAIDLVGFRANLAFMADRGVRVIAVGGGTGEIEALHPRELEALAAEALAAVGDRVLIVGCLLALVYAVVAARPRVSQKKLTLDDIRENRANILFFGNFVNMSEDDFVEGMKDLMLDTDHLYTNMVRDLYGLGQVLKRKFEILRISYNIFMATLIISVTLFVYAFANQPAVAAEFLQPLGGTGP